MFGLTPYYRKNEGLMKRNDVWNFRTVFDDFFNDSFFPAVFTAGGNPIRADIRETEKEYVIDAEIPGAKKEDIKLDLRDDVLTISVEQKTELNEERGNYIRKERRFGSYSRSFYVENVKHEDVSAKYENGILSVTLLKSGDSKENKRKIEIQ